MNESEKDLKWRMDIRRGNFLLGVQMIADYYPAPVEFGRLVSRALLDLFAMIDEDSEITAEQNDTSHDPEH